VHGKKADVWAAGITLFILATQVHPFAHHKGLPDLLQAISHDKIDYSRIEDPGLVSLLQKMLEREPNIRATARELLEDEWLRPVEIFEAAVSSM
jgi:serine/threonine protein kinase